MSVIILTKEEGDIIEFTLSNVPFFGTAKKAYWGWMSTSEMLTEAQIIVLQANAEFNPGAKVVANFSAGNATPMYLYMAERESEPAKTKFYNNDLDQGPIGPGQVFSVIGIVNGWRVYRSSYKTQISVPTEFRPN